MNATFFLAYFERLLSAVWCWCIRPLRVKSPRLRPREVTRSQSLQSESRLWAVRGHGAEGCDLGSGGFRNKTIDQLTRVRSTQDKESSISILILLHRNVGMLVFKLGLKVCCQGVICWNRRHLLSFRI